MYERDQSESVKWGLLDNGRDAPWRVASGFLLHGELNSAYERPASRTMTVAAELALAA